MSLRLCARLSWVIITPLGSLVEPVVNRIRRPDAQQFYLTAVACTLHGITNMIPEKVIGYSYNTDGVVFPSMGDTVWEFSCHDCSSGAFKRFYEDQSHSTIGGRCCQKRQKQRMSDCPYGASSVRTTTAFLVLQQPFLDLCSSFLPSLVSSVSS